MRKSILGPTFVPPMILDLSHNINESQSPIRMVGCVFTLNTLSVVQTFQGERIFGKRTSPNGNARITGMKMGASALDYNVSIVFTKDASLRFPTAFRSSRGPFFRR